jgi:hypothetical protein
VTTERDPRTRIVQSWLREDAHEDAERVLLRALEEVDTTPQRRPVWPARRIADMNAYAKAAIAVAAVIVLAVAGLQFLPRNGSVGGPPTVTSSPATTLSPSPTAVPPPPSLGTASLAPGRYALAWRGPAATIQVPAGWTGTEAGVVKHADGGDEITWGGWSPAPSEVFGDACKSVGTVKPVSGTVQGLVDALDRQAGTDATVTDITIGGVAGKRIDLVESAALDRATCSDGATGPLQVWHDGLDGYYALAPGNRGVVEAIDVDGQLVVFVSVVGPQTTAADIAELDTIVGSLEFGP